MCHSMMGLTRCYKTAVFTFIPYIGSFLLKQHFLRGSEKMVGLLLYC